MSRDAPRVHVDPAAIARLEAMAVQLPQDMRVDVRLEDGDRVRGMVSMTPTVQAFFDPDGREGMNGVAKLECETGDIRYLWLDSIGSVEPLSNPSPPEASTRHPVDPNAPSI